MEEWKIIDGYDGQYMVSNLGRVKSLERWVRSKPGVHRIKKEQILKPCQDNCRILSL